jgi:hypothetical protein
MSFQKAHQISNELGEVLVTAELNCVNGNSGTYNEFSLQPAIAGRNYRVLEVGFTVYSSGTAAANDIITVGTSVDPDKFIAAGLVSGVGSSVPANPAVGATYSTSSGGGDTWVFNVTDSDGCASVEAGELLVYNVTNTANTSAGILFMRLAPIAGKDVFA